MKRIPWITFTLAIAFLAALVAVAVVSLSLVVGTVISCVQLVGN